MAYPFDPEQPLPDPLTPDAATRVRDEPRELLPAWVEASHELVVHLGELVC